MPASQLKRLKASLREQGVIGPQQSKKQKKKNAQDVQARDKRRLRKSTALENIREWYNPFQFKMNSRGPKFQVTTDRPLSANAAKGIKGRPGVTLSLSEQKRRDTLLVDMQRRNKVGGILDRRFGENDPSVTQEERALERFAKEKERHYKKRSLFDLEEYAPGEGLTHMGKSLALEADPALRDDFEEDDLLLDDDDLDLSQIDPRRLKRMRGLDYADEEENGVPPRKKSKQEVMKELIAKSKFHKYERQVEKEDDDEMRAEIDKELAEIRPLLYASKALGEKDHDTEQTSQPHLIAGMDKAAFNSEYDLRVRQMILDRRAQPTERTKTDEEIAEEEATRLKELESKRMKRMRGEKVTDDEDEDDEEQPEEADGAPDDDMEADEFGLGKGVRTRPTATQLGFDDEDDFLIDDDLVASGSELELDDSESDNGEEIESEEEDDEFTKGLLTEAESRDPAFADEGENNGHIPFTFPCPQSHEELLEVASGIALTDLPTVVQRIRALYHPKLDSGNKERLGKFACVLVQHVGYLGTACEGESFPVIEALIRHIQSLAKGSPVEVAQGFRAHLLEMEKDRPLAFNTGDLIILTAIGTIFPTSDHFHQVVTPAALAMARFLGQKIPQEVEDLSIGTYSSILFIQYQQLAKRYVPEVMNFSINTIMSLAPVECRVRVGFVPVLSAGKWSRISSARDTKVRKLDFADCKAPESKGEYGILAAKVAILSTTIAVLAAAAEIWAGKPAFLETFAPVAQALNHLKAKQCRSQLPGALNQAIDRALTILERQLQVARLSRRPLELHHHRPLAIRTFIPKFEDTFDPDKHYDPNRERAESAKLKAEHRKERKGAMRELRKDANFMAREKLKLKKSQDEAYEKKFKRLVAEIQGEEGREANEYEREKVARKRSKHR